MAENATQYDAFQRDFDRALEGYNAVYSRISMSLVLVGVLLGFMFTGPNEMGFRGAMQTVAGKDSFGANMARLFYLMSLIWYVHSLCRLLYSASHRPAFLDTYHTDSWFSLSEEEFREKEIQQSGDLARYYRRTTQDLLTAYRLSNVLIGAGVVCYVIAEFLLFWA